MMPGQNMNRRLLRQENEQYAGSGGVSRENRSLGLRPAFRDNASGKVYPSCFADGRPAPFHLLDGLPDALVMRRADSGQVLEAKAGLVCGFLLHDRFYTRDEAAALRQRAHRLRTGELPERAARGAL
jgi:hypothetical protein